jgi:competence protein ComEC
VQTTFTATDTVQQIWLDDLEKSGTPIRQVSRGDVIGFQDEPEVILRVLNPGDGDILKGDKSALEDDRSIVLRIEYGETNILLAGDIESGAEINMGMQASDLLRSQVLKVAGHGSYNASTQSFIDAVKPAVSIISVGAGNKPGDPSPLVLDRLHNAGSQIYRTDQDGTVEITAEKERFWVQSER